MDALIKRVEEQNSFVRWFRQFACKANGMPIEPEAAPSVLVEHQHTHQHQGAPPVATPAANPVPSTPPSPVTAPAEPARRFGWAKTAAIVALSAAGGGSMVGGVAAVVNLLRGGQSQVVVPVERASGGSLLQDLEDRGFHLPNEGQ